MISVDHIRLHANNWKKCIGRKSAPLVSPMKRDLCSPEERDKSAAKSAPKLKSGTSLNVLHGERLALIVEFKITLWWPAKPHRLHPVRPHPPYLPCRDISSSQCMQWRILTLMNMLPVLMSRSESVLCKILIVMLLTGHRVPFQLDTGATVNILPEESFKEVYGEGSLSLLDNAEVTLVMYNKTEEKPIGKKRVQVVNPRNGRKYSIEFVVRQTSAWFTSQWANAAHLCGPTKHHGYSVWRAIAEPNTTYNRIYSRRMCWYVFRGEGKLEGDLHLEIDPNVPPVQLPTRKVPITIKEKLKEELDRLEGLNIITPVNVPTSGISATVVTEENWQCLTVCGPQTT